LTAFLVDEAARRFQESISFHFNVKPNLDLQQRRVRFVSRESNQRAGSPIELPYDLLVGADGAGSSVRAALEQTVPDVTVSVLAMVLPLGKKLTPLCLCKRTIHTYSQHQIAY
jgi:2-polyprenyl-6-methoxyphenol hydroxylase-like FAD-dependent oxidoreductase